jgi:cytoskeletal protein CcmA (bactofilin family)
MIQRVFLALIALVLFPLNAHADGVSFKTSRGNAYYAGSNVNVVETVPGDIVAAGRNVIITGNAGDDVLAAGGTVDISGKAGGDARIAGGNVTVNSEIGGEAVIAGGHIKLLPGANIRYDLLAAAGNVTIEGTIGGIARINAGTVTMNGTVNKDVEVRTGQLVIGRNAVINGNLRYEAPRKAQIDQGAVIKGQTIFTSKDYMSHKKRLRSLMGFWWIVKLLATAAAALVIYFSLRKRTEEFAALALNRFGSELLIGFILLIVIPAAILILFISVVGWLLGLIGLFFYIAFIVLSVVLGAVVFSGLIGKYLFKKEQYVTWPMILLGVFIYQIVGLVPVLGWLVTFAFFLSGMGAFSHLIYTGFKKA